MATYCYDKFFNHFNPLIQSATEKHPKKEKCNHCPPPRFSLGGAPFRLTTVPTMTNGIRIKDLPENERPRSSWRSHRIST